MRKRGREVVKGMVEARAEVEVREGEGEIIYELIEIVPLKEKKRKTKKLG